VNSPTFLSLGPDEFDEAAFAFLSEGLQKTIKQSPEYQGLQEPQPTEARIETRPVTEEPPPPKSVDDYGALDDAVPELA